MPIVDLILTARLRQLEETWLEARCCRGTTVMPVRLLAAQLGGGCLVGDVVGRLRCEACGGRPMLVALVEDPAGQSSGRAGAAPGWRIVLRDAPRQPGRSGG
jgi:hypothetical protein